MSFSGVFDKSTQHADDVSDVRACGGGEIQQLPTSSRYGTAFIPSLSSGVRGDIDTDSLIPSSVGVR